MFIRSLCLLLLLPFQATVAQSTLSADGAGSTYELITAVLAPGYNPIEAPDCSHPSFGRHIDEIVDDTLGFAFRFFLHLTPDDDRCINFDRQRNEIKTYSQSPDELLGVEGETVEYRWKFKLDANFQASSSFTHLHQLKAVGGTYASMPLITLTARKASPDRLELRYAEAGTQTTLTQIPLAPLKGAWVEAIETISYANPGVYLLQLRRICDDAILLDYQNMSINTQKAGATFTRPKWGIYRSLNNAADLRDEIVLFGDFSIDELYQANCTTATCPITLSPKIFLQGNYTGSGLSNALGLAQLLPSSEPYTGLGYSHTSGGGNEHTNTAILNAHEIVDWVLVELRDKTDATMVLASRAALLKKDGTIVDMDGFSPLTFSLSPDDYYVSVRHRNHLSVMTATVVYLN